MDSNDFAWILSLVVAFMAGQNMSKNWATSIALICLSFSVTLLSVSIDNIEASCSVKRSINEITK